jgi:hypothetical protein
MVQGLGICSCSQSAESGPAAVAYTRSLFESNHLDSLIRFPDKKAQEGIRVERHPGFVEISWLDRQEDMATEEHLLFTAEGRFLCNAAEYAVGDVTGDGTEDVVAMEQCGAPFRFNRPNVKYMGYKLQEPPIPSLLHIVYPMDRPSMPARYLWTSGFRSDYRFSLADLAGDGVPLIIGCATDPDIGWIGLGSPPKNEPVSSMRTVVWSVKHGLPVLLLAFDYTDYEIVKPKHPGEPATLRCHVAPDVTRDIEGGDAVIRWDAKQRRFDLSELEKTGLLVYISRTMPE